ncbi:MAG TPA: hypothetical protein PLD47_04380 [Aggregatilineales bacterium]|nr:hypothetical protein [Anaerolineales bacterium]HRE46939.1 hypothetical protein [Aggregatilineales bacterium]
MSNSRGRRSRNNDHGGWWWFWGVFIFLTVASKGRIFGSSSATVVFFGILVVMSLIHFASTFANGGGRQNGNSVSARLARDIQRRAEEEADRQRFTAQARRQMNTEYDPTDLEREKMTPAEVGKRAMRRAGNRPDTWELTLDDIGLLAYHGDTTPDLVRLAPVPTDAQQIRPFLVISLPYQRGRGTITFAIHDEAGEERYTYKQLYELKQGQNFVTTKTWLPLPTNRSGGRWSVRVSIGETVFAVHEFIVRPAYDGQIKEFIKEDGEIDPWLTHAVERERLNGGMSLDELLMTNTNDAEEETTASALH